jgi:DNA-directed RNA polymerase specialized sigma24 family protein
MTDMPAVAHESAEQVVTELYQRHRLGLIGTALVLTGDPPMAEDVVQEAFAGLYRAMPRLNDPGKALGYVRASVINGCRLVHRTRTRSLRLHSQFRPRPAGGLVRRIGHARPRGEPACAAGRRTAARPGAGGARDALPARHVRLPPVIPGFLGPM